MKPFRAVCVVRVSVGGGLCDLRLRRFLYSILATVGAFLALLAPADATAAGLRWSAPVLVDAQAPLASANSINAVSCPSGGLCVAGDSGGDLLVSTDPNGGPAAWRAVRHLDLALTNGSEDAGGGSGVEGVSCPSTRLCVATDGPDLLTSTDPTGGLGAWHVVAGVDRFGSLVGVSCATASLCVAFDRRGDILVSTHPVGAKRTWKLVRVLDVSAGGVGADFVASMSCPSRSLCVASDMWGQRVLSSTNPSGGARAWKIARIKAATNNPNGVHTSIACESVSACVIVGQTFSGVSFDAHSSDPAGGADSWKVTQRVFKGAVDEVACSRSYCLANTAAPGELEYTTDPTGGASAWRAVYDTSTLSLTWGVACAPTTLCLTFAYQNVATSEDPAGGQGAWRTAAIDSFDQLGAISCRMPTTCVAVDDGGRTLASTDPAGGPATWQASDADPGDELLNISCTTTPLCVAGDKEGNVASSLDPTAAVPSWRIALTNSSDGLTWPVNSIACPSLSLCVGTLYYVDQEGGSVEGSSVVTSTDPTGSASAWKETDLNVSPTAPVLKVIACPSVSLCVALDDARNTETSTNPTGGRGAWKRRPIHGLSRAIFAGSAISCPSVSLCVGVDPGGDVFTSTDPQAGRWKVAKLGRADPFKSVACPSTRMCVAVDSNRIFTSSNPTGGARAWQRSAPIDGDLTSISCASTSLCVAVDGEGYAVTGRRG